MPSPFEVGGVFYRKEEDGTFSMCQFDRFEWNHPVRGPIVKWLTYYYKTQNRLFVFKSRPWKTYKP